MEIKFKDKESNQFVRDVANQKYEYGFTTNVHTDVIPKGLNEDVVRLISQKKGEPEWLLDFRLKAYRHWLTLPVPTWGHVHVPPIDFQGISYYADPLAKKPKNKEIDPELEKTFDKLGIPLEERLALSGTAVDAVMDSVSVKTTFKKQLAEKGIIFSSIGEAVKIILTLSGSILAVWCLTPTTSRQPSTPLCSPMAVLSTSRRVCAVRWS